LELRLEFGFEPGVRKFLEEIIGDGMCRGGVLGKDRTLENV
jgi:hypothetical protein